MSYTSLKGRNLAEKCMQIIETKRPIASPLQVISSDKIIQTIDKVAKIKLVCFPNALTILETI